MVTFVLIGGAGQTAERPSEVEIMAEQCERMLSEEAPSDSEALMWSNDQGVCAGYMAGVVNTMAFYAAIADRLGNEMPSHLRACYPTRTPLTSFAQAFIEKARSEGDLRERGPFMVAILAFSETWPCPK
jgi:hypothetical protein